MGHIAFISKRMPDFAAAHTLRFHHGGCANLHGHNYGVTVNISGPIQETLARSAYGMVMDFGDLKRIYKEAVHEVLDHSLILANEWPEWYRVYVELVKDKVEGRTQEEAIKLVDEQLGKVAHLDIPETTAEWLSVWVTDTMSAALSKEYDLVTVESVVVFETTNSWAERYG